MPQNTGNEIGEWIPVDELLKTIDGQVDEESEGDEEQQDLAALRQDRGDAYAWEAGYSASWKTNQNQDWEGSQHKRCIFYPQRDAYGKIEEIRSLYIDREHRINRPYMDTYEYQQEQFFSNSRKKPNVMRALVVLIDFTSAMREPDYKPNRITCLKSILEIFVLNFFKNSPISKISFCLLTDKDAVLLSPLVGSPETLLKILDDLAKMEEQPQGDPSLQAGLERANLALQPSSEHSSKEVLLLYGSCLTNDAGDITVTKGMLKANRIRVSAISLAPELRILRDICLETGGTYVVSMKRSHLKEAIMVHGMPQTELDETAIKNELMIMGFPDMTSMSTVSLCVCHNQLGFDGYSCPRCQIRSCSIPTECKACGLALVSSIDIARCQVMDALPPPFIPIAEKTLLCFLCSRKFVTGGGQCLSCLSHCCFDCDILIHSTLKFCPGCTREETLLRQNLPLPMRPPTETLPLSHPLSEYFKKVQENIAMQQIELV